jgi:anaerobic selenocysteine-containing dehydrogenase
MTIPGINIVRSTCRICYNNCGVLVRMKDGFPSAVEGDPENPMSKGRLCPKGLASLEYLNHPDRLKHPLKRTGKRGDGRWEQISWDDALEAVAAGLNRAKETYGVLSVIFFRGASKGLPDDHLARFANLFGSPNISSPAPFCFVPGLNGARLTYGYYSYPDYDYPLRCIVVWGSNPEATRVAEYDEILRAVERGAKLIVIDPLLNELAKKADLWIRIRPGTDLALALGMIHVMIEEDLYDRKFVEDWTVGFEALRAHVGPYTPEKVEGITWVPKNQMMEAARLYGKEKPGFVQWGNGIETNINSFQACRAVAILRSISGNLGVPGGEVKWSEPGGLTKGSPDFLCQNNIAPEVRLRRLSMKDNLMPIVYYALHQSIVKAILHDDPYPVRAAYLQGGNFLTSYTNARETQRALERLDFLAVSDLFMTPTAMMADVVLPVASYLEFDSIEQPWHYPIASIQQEVARVGESWPDGKILNELARKLQIPQAWSDMNHCLNLVLKPAGITFEEFRKIGFLVGTKHYRHYEKNGFDTPSKKAELFSKRLEEWGFDPLPIYRELPETPFSEPRAATEYPFIMTSRKADVYRHSGGRQIPSLRRERPEPTLSLHPDAAKQLGIEEGEEVFVETRRGKIRQKARWDEALDPRVVELDYAWWFPEKKTAPLYGWEESNINILTDDRPPYNREMGSPNMRGIFCKVYKAG